MAEEAPHLGESPTPHLERLVESMHGHRKKTLFFLGRLHDGARRTGRPPDGLRVLELGCGNGSIVTLPVAEQGFDITGVDLHEPSIAWARANGADTSASFVLADAVAFDSSERYDAVILSDILEHVDDPAALLEVAVRHLAEDGEVLISIPNGSGPYELEQRFVRTRLGRNLPVLARSGAKTAARLNRRLRRLGPRPEEPSHPAYNDESGHVQFFSLPGLERLLAEAGLRIVQRRNGSFVGGDLTYFLYLAVPRLVPVSLWAADHVPARLAGTWYLACGRL